jgi:hypothetical protein
MSFYVAAPPSGEPAVHPVDEVLPPTKLGIYGAQHVLAFYAGAVIVPILLAGAIGLRGDDLVYLISADAYRKKFGFPFVICVRENTKETIPSAFERRLDNTPVQERMAALVEIAKIANLRLDDLVEEPVPEPAVALAGA